MPQISRDAVFFKNAQELYDEIAAEFDRSRGNEPWHVLVQFIEIGTVAKELSSQQDGTSVMDLGCGNGRNLQLLGKTFPCAACIGIDLSWTLLKHAWQIYRHSPKVSLVHGSMTHLPFRPASQDVIACVAALHHSPSKESMAATLDQMRNTLKSGGLLVVSTWAKWQPRFRWKVIKNIVLLKRKPGLVNIPWKASADGMARNRPYFLLSRSEACRLVNEQFNIIDAMMLGGQGNNENVFILARSRVHPA